jgi:tetratricopeptide (TPR) repeat protein
VFPHQRLLRISQGDTILLAADSPLDCDASVVQASQLLVDLSSTIQSDLTRHFGTCDVATLLLRCVLLDEQSLARLMETQATAGVNFDQGLQLEFRAGRHLYERRMSNVEDSILAAARPEWFAEQLRRLNCGARHSMTLHELAMLFLKAGNRDTAATLVEMGLANDPEASELIADHLILAGRPDHAVLDRLFGLPDAPAAAAANRVGVEYWKRKQYKDAVVVFESLSQRFPHAPNVWTNLAINYSLLGNREKAGSAHRRAMESDPTNDFSRRESSLFFNQSGAAAATGNEQDLTFHAKVQD